MSEIIRVENLTHRYGTHLALDGVSFEVQAGRTFGLLGPNGSGKSTLFRILATIMRPAAGRANVLGLDVVADQARLRPHLGVVFQSPSLDPHLTVAENLRHAGHLYGLSGPDLSRRIEDRLRAMGVFDRASHRVKTLSGGLKRRVELAQCLLHDPAVLLLDEPSTGLDPRARKDLWQHLARQQSETGVTMLVTTHDMDEADACDELAIFDRGRLVARGSPDALKRRVGGECVTIDADAPAALLDEMHGHQLKNATLVDGSIRIETTDGAEMVGRLMAAFGERIRSITVGKPTLEDVFIHETGRRFEPAGVGEAAA